MSIYRIILLVSFSILTINATWAQSEPDFAEAGQAAARRLRELIRIDTSNPPGNETKVAEYLKTILDAEGIEAEVLELEPGRGNLVARIRGNGKKKPVLLMGHTDVVGVDRDAWTVAPFEGLIRDGYLYGRGAADDKGGVATFLEVFLLIHRQIARQGAELDRDVIFLAEAGEEGTTQVGIDFLVEKHWDRIESEFALNEGGNTRVEDGKVKFVGVQTSEKVIRRLKLVARGSSGHGSIPRPDNAIARLSAAVAKLAAFQPPMRLNETTRMFFRTLAATSAAEDAFLFQHLADPEIGSLVEKTFRESERGDFLLYNSMLRSSIAPTIVEGGFRNNVIPPVAEATLDVRLLPGEDLDEFIAEVRRVIGDEAVEVEPLPAYRPAGLPSPLDSEMYRALDRAREAVFPDAITLPFMSTGGTDSAQLRSKGVKTYGVDPPASDEDAKGVHGNDERIWLDGLGPHVELVYRAVMEVARAR